MLRSLINKVSLGLAVILLFSIIGCVRQGDLNSGDISSTSNGVSESSSFISYSESYSEDISSEIESSSESSGLKIESSSSVSSASGSVSSISGSSSVSSSSPSFSSSASSSSGSSSSGSSTSGSGQSPSSVSGKSSSSVSSSSESGSEFSYEGWTLVWSDEFSGPQIDGSVWSFEKGYLRNNELQNYTDSPNNAYIENGMLIIKTIKEPSFAHNVKDEEGNVVGKWMDFSSASLHSKNKKSFTYGRFEIRAKLPYGNSIWPAFWICGQNGTWPQNGEIDIMEFWGGPDSDHILRSNVHWDDNGHKQWGGKAYQLSGNEKFADDFHTIGVEWDQEALRFYVDGNFHHVFYLNTPVLQSIFTKPFFLRMNTAISPNVQKWGDAYLNTYPQTFEIDYVRVYQKT